jgi:MFS family permease
VALPALQHDLQASGTALLWISNAYTLLLAAGILVGGSLGDHYGRKRVYMLGIALFAGASLFCGLAPNAGFLIGARAVQGVGGALMVPGSLALISASFEPGQRGAAIGLWSTFATLTTIAGPILGGFLAGLGVWRHSRADQGGAGSAVSRTR